METKSIEVLDNYEENLSDKLMRIADRDQVLKALVDIVLIGLGIPFAGIITSGIKGVLSYYIQDKTILFFQELARHPEKIKKDEVQSQEFVHKFLITYNAAVKTYHDEKIRILARLFIYGNKEEEIEVDEYEEYLKILEELSYREIVALKIIDDLYSKTKPQKKYETSVFMIDADRDVAEPKTEPEDQFAQFEGELYEKLKTVCHVNPEDIQIFLVRLYRSGLYEKFSYMFDDIGTEGKGKLTSLYYRIRFCINEKIE